MSKNVVIEGEASETDDEDTTPPTVSIEPITARVDSLENIELRIDDLQPRRARVHIDEKLVQRWRILGADTLTVSWRAVHPQIKRVETCEASTASTFATLQTCSQSLRRATEALCRVERNVFAIAEGAKLLPDLSQSKETMKH